MRQEYSIIFQNLRKNPVIETDSFQDLLNNAKAFYQAGSRCCADIKFSPTISNYLTGPAIVCFALSLELYFKLILKIFTGSYSKGKDGHNLIKLLKTIPEKQRRELSKFIEERMHMGEAVFESKIEKISDAFLKWRYAHEEERLVGSPEDIRGICDNFHIFVAKQKPELKFPEERAHIKADWPNGF